VKILFSVIKFSISKHRATHAQSFLREVAFLDSPTSFLISMHLTF